MIYTFFTSALGLCLFSIFNISGLTYIPNTAVLVYIFVVSIAVFVDASSSKRLNHIKIQFCIAYFIRLLTMFCDVFLRNYVRILGSGKDSERFFRHIVGIATGAQNDSPYLFALVFGKLFKIVGISRLLAEFFVVMFSMIAIYYTCLALQNFGIDNRRISIAMLLYSLLPNNIFMSAVLLRESIIYMFESIGLYRISIWFTKRSNVNLCIAIIDFLFASAFHTGCIGFVFGLVILQFIFDNNIKEFKINLHGALLCVVFLFLFVFLYTNYGDVFFGKIKNVNDIADIASGEALGLSSYSKYVGDSSTPIRMLIYTIPRIFYFLFSPLPWQWRGINDVLAFCFNSVFFLYVSIKTYKTMKEKRIKSQDIVLLKCIIIVLTMAIFIFAWGTQNSGTALRHREKMTPFIISLFSIII